MSKYKRASQIESEIHRRTGGKLGEKLSVYFQRRQGIVLLLSEKPIHELKIPTYNVEDITTEHIDAMVEFIQGEKM